MRYIDSGTRRPEDTLGQWLQDHLPQAAYFGCQTAYVSADGILAVADELRDCLSRGGQAELVVGSNDGGVLSADLRSILDLFDAGGTGHLYLVGASDVLMHPKTFYIESANGRRHALVGSANLTGRGLDGNIEAAIAVTSDNDDLVVLDEIRDAIHTWRRHTNSVEVTRANLADLIRDAAVDRPRPSSPPAPQADRTRRARRFPRLGRILGRRRGLRGGETEAPTHSGNGGGAQGPAGPPGSTPSPVVRPVLPGGAVGIVKVLSGLDTKAFHGGSGTPYIALPAELAAALPMSPYGRNQEPRVDVDLVATLDAVPGVTVPHINTRGSTNITWVGAGTTQTSHTDLRLNYLKPITTGIRNAAGAAQVRVPAAGDVAVVEFVTPTTVQLAFVTHDPEHGRLHQIATAAGGGWNWISAQDLP